MQSIINVGVLDKDIDMFESQYKLTDGVLYNSYLVLDDEIAIIDTVDKLFFRQWMDNIVEAVGDKQPKYLVVQHVEPDHSACISRVVEKFPEITVVATAKALEMIGKFYHLTCNTRAVTEGEVLSLGTKQLNFYTAPMVHWPEVMVSYESTTGTLFSADAFGRFGGSRIVEDINEYAREARRYYYGIVGKYGRQVKMLLSKVSKLTVNCILSSHGCKIDTLVAPVVELYTKWCDSLSENDGIMLAYTSVYGNTKVAVEKLAEQLKEQGKEVYVVDIARTDDIYKELANAYYYKTLVLATTTYNMSIFPAMYAFVHHLASRSYCNHRVAVMENGSWAPTASKVIKEMLNGCNVEYVGETVTINSALDKKSSAQLETLAKLL